MTFSLRSNLWKLKAERFLGDFWIFAPILVPFFKTQGLSATEIFAIEATYNVIMSVSEIPTGYFADATSRKLAMVLSAVMRPLALLVYILSTSFWGFVLAECVMGFAASLRSGTDSALLYDTLIEEGREKEHKKIEGAAHFFTNLGTSIAGIIGGFLSAIAIKLPFIATIFVSLFHLPLILSIKEPKRQKAQTKSLKSHYIEIMRAIRFTLRHKSVLYASLCFMLVTNVHTIGIWSYYMYYHDLGISIEYYGFLAALFWLFSGIGARLCYILSQRWGEKAALLLLLLVIPNLIVLSQTKSLWALPLIGFNAVLMGMSFPLLRDIIHRNTRSSRRATVISVANMARRLFYVFFAFAVGFAADQANIQSGLLLLSVLFLATAALPFAKLCATEMKNTRNR